VGDAHDTEVRPLAGSTVRVDQLDPSQVDAAPEPATATQKVGLAHDTPLRSGAVVADPPATAPGDGICTGPVHAMPFQVSTCPVLSTTWQKVAEGQDTPVRTEVSPNGWGSLHAWPFQVEIPPPADMQNAAVGQEMLVTLPQSFDPADQVEPLK
jgi:hypothetical protein